MCRVLVMFAAAAALAGCAAPLPYMKVGATRDQIEEAQARCAYDVKMQKIDRAEQADLIRLCMRSKGFRPTGA